MIAQPAISGMRQPQSRHLRRATSMRLDRTPSSAANMTATCWLPDCQLQ